MIKSKKREKFNTSRRGHGKQKYDRKFVLTGGESTKVHKGFKSTKDRRRALMCNSLK